METGWIAALVTGMFGVLIALITGIFVIRGNRKQITVDNSTEHKNLENLTNSRGEEFGKDHVEIKLKLDNLAEMKKYVNEIRDFTKIEGHRNSLLGNSHLAIKTIQNDLLIKDDEIERLSLDLETEKNSVIKLKSYNEELENKIKKLNQKINELSSVNDREW